MSPEPQSDDKREFPTGSPKRDVTSPVEIPKRKVTSPLVSPKDETMSPVGSPKQDMTSPIGSPKQEVISPVGSPKQEMTSPVISPKQEMKSPIGSPKQVIVPDLEEKKPSGKELTSQSTEKASTVRSPSYYEVEDSLASLDAIAEGIGQQQRIQVWYIKLLISSQ